jgi:ATP-dependent helicase/DNAse subunit B
MDPASRPEPVEVETPAGIIRLCGRIDRVDRVHTPAGEGLFVVDYKTGRLPGPAETLEGRNTQVPLYTAAVESLLDEKALGGAFHGIKDGKKSFFAAVKVYRGNVKEDDKYVENRQQAMTTVGLAVEGIAAGRFDLLPSKDACKYCEYRRICHFSPARDELRRATAGEVSS